jgi:hypothetical protein
VTFAVTAPDAADDAVDVLVGGLGADRNEQRSPRTPPWVLAGAALLDGSNVVGSLPEPVSSAQRIVAALRPAVPVTVVEGDAAESAFARATLDALGSRARSVALDDRPGCDREMAEATRSPKSSIVLAMGPTLAAECLQALTHVSSPPVEVGLPASSSFRPPTVGGTGPFSVLVPMALPWPTWADPAAARFRRATGSTSYHAMWSFAGAELAVAAARRSTGPLTIASFAGRWETDLVTLQDGAVLARFVGVADGTGWAPLSAG